MAKSPFRSKKSRTGATRWAQLGGKKKDNKQRVAEANKLKKAAEPDILQTTSGNRFKVMDVAGHGNCAMLTVWTLYKITGGVPYDEVAAAVYPTGGIISVELQNELRSMRKAVADASDLDLSELGDGEESKPLGHVLHNVWHKIETKEMFRKVALSENGYLCPLAMRLAAVHLGLDGLRVVKSVDGVLESCDQQGDLTDADVNLALFDGERHFSALIPTTPEVVQPEDAGTSTSEPDAGATPAKQEAAAVAVQPEDTGTSTSEPDAGATPAKQEAAEVAVQPEDAGTSTSEPDAGATPAKQEAAEVAVQPEDAGTSTSEPDAGATPAKQEAAEVAVQPEDAGTSTSEPDAASVDVSVVQQDGAFDAGDGGDEWVLVGGRPMISREVRPTEHTGYTHENQFDVLHDEDEEDDEAGMFTVVWEPWCSAQRRRNKQRREGPRPPRWGRRVAGRRKAQPSKRGGQGGSKYLKRCPARDTRVQRKRYRGREQEARGTTWSGVVRGGAHPGDGKAPAFDGAVPSASAPSAPSSADSRGGGPDEDTPEDRDAMDVQKAHDASMAPRVARADGKCKDSMCGKAATYCFKEGEVEYCDTHYPSRMGWAIKTCGKRSRKPSDKLVQMGSAEASDDDGGGGRGGGRGGVRGRGGKRKTGGGGCRSSSGKHKSNGGGGGGDGNDNDGAAPMNMVGGGGRGDDCGSMEVSDDDSGGLGGDFGGGDSSDEEVDDGYGSAASTSWQTGPTTSASSPIDSRDEDGEPVVGETAPAFDGAVPAVSASSAPSSIDSRDGGEGGGKGKGKGKAKQRETVVTTPATDKVEAGEQKGVYTREGNGHKDIGDILCEPWNDEVKQIMRNNRKLAEEQAKKYEGTFTQAKRRKDDTLTFRALIETLVWGLTGDGEGQLEIIPGMVYFKREKLVGLRKYYDRNAKYNPAVLGVDLGRAYVKIKGKVYVVDLVEDGRYTLRNSTIRISQKKLFEGRCDNMGKKVKKKQQGRPVVLNDTCSLIDGKVYTVVTAKDGLYTLVLKIGQWELLEKRCAKDGGVLRSSVTLEEDLKKYILSLIDMHEELWRSKVPWLLEGQTPARGVSRLRTDTLWRDWSKKDPSSKEAKKLCAVAEMRRLSRLAFVNTSVADIFHTLPIRDTRDGDDDHEEACFLRAFATGEHSLCELNGLGRLRHGLGEREKENDDKKMVILSGKEVHGAYVQSLDHAAELLQYCFRLNRPVSLHEAYIPICDEEREVLVKHFDCCWTENEDFEEGFFVEEYRINGEQEKMTIAMRFSLERCNKVIPTIPTAMIRVLARDNKRYGITTDQSNHTGAMAPSAKAMSVTDYIIGRDTNTSREIRQATGVVLRELDAKVKNIRRIKRAEASNEEAGDCGLEGPPKKVRRSKAPFMGFPIEECLGQIELLFEGMYRNGMEKVLRTIGLIDEHCIGKDGWCFEILKAAQIRAQNAAKRAVFTEDQLLGNEEQQKKIAYVVKQLRAHGIEGGHFEVASAATGVRDTFSSASLRNQGFFNREARRLCVENERESRNLGRMVVTLPKKNKVSTHGNGSGGGVAREHVIDAICDTWYAVLNVIGRPFFRSFYTSDEEHEEQSPYIGPWDRKGGQMSILRFNNILRKIGQTYLAVENLTFNQLRTASGSLVMSESTTWGIRMDDPVIADFAASILTSVKMMQKRYDIHRRTVRQSNAIHNKYRRVIDFSQGVYGILKGAVERAREMAREIDEDLRGVIAEEGPDGEGGRARGMEGDLEETSRGAGSNGMDGGDMRRRLQAIKIRERELELMKLRLDLMEREQQLQRQAGGSAAGVVVEMTERASTPVEPEQAPNAPTGGALQSQCCGEDRFDVNGEARLRRCERPAVNKTSFCVDHQQKAAGGSSTGETGDIDAGVGKKRAATQDSKPVAKRKRVKINDGERGGMLDVLEAIKTAHARARAKVSAGGDDAEKYAKILQHMDCERFRDIKGHYGTVKYLLKNDAEFNPGQWYMKSEFGTAPPKVNKQKLFIGIRDRLTKYDEQNDVADKFVWKWWTPS